MMTTTDTAFDVAAEHSLLGSMLHHGSDVETAYELLGEDTNDLFAKPENHSLYMMLVDWYKVRLPHPILGDPVPFEGLCEMFKRDGQLEAVGGASHLGELSTWGSTCRGARYYCTCLLKSAAIRGVVLAYDLLKRAIKRNQLDESVLAIVEDSIARIRNSEFPEHAADRASDISGDVVEVMEARTRTDEVPPSYLATGFQGLDHYLQGLRPGDMIVLAARPGVGKTALSLQMALDFTVHQGKSVLFYSLEMTADQLTQRCLSSLSDIPLTGLRTWSLAPVQAHRLDQAHDQLTRARLYWDTTRAIGMNQVAAKARKHQRVHGLDLVVIDYIQLLAPLVRSDSRAREVEESSRRIKIMAGELDVPVIAVSQLSRNSEQERRPPRLSDLRWSGAIEQDADVVMLMNRVRPKKNGPGVALDGDLVHVDIAKHRNGPCGSVDFAFDGSTQRFTQTTTMGVYNVRSPEPANDDDLPF